MAGSVLSSWLSKQKSPIAGMVKPTSLPPSGVVSKPSYSTTPTAGVTGNKTAQKRVTTTASVPITQPQTTGYESSGAGGFTMPEYGGYQFNYEMPQIPGEYQVTEEDLAKFYSQATAEATQLFDPQVLSLQQTLAKNLLAAEQSGGTIQAQYDAVIKSVDEWKLQAIKDEQARWFARGMGIGGGLVQAEIDVEKQALGLKTTAGTEKAQKLSDIEAQKQLLTEQGGQSEQELVKQKAAYIATRQQEIQDAYVSHKETIAQQTFQNQMAVQQFGMTAQAQAFDQWLQQTSLANEIWYQGQQQALAELENAQNEAYRQEALAASKTGSSKSTLQNTLAANRAKGGLGIYENLYSSANMGVGTGGAPTPTTMSEWLDYQTWLEAHNAPTTNYKYGNASTFTGTTPTSGQKKTTTKKNV